MQRLGLAALFLLAACASTSESPEPPAADGLELDVWLPGEEMPYDEGAGRLWAWRVIDTTTGKPIAGARIHAVAEHDQPLSGTWWPPLMTTTSDADGFAWLDLRGKGIPWLYVDAPGYAPWAMLGIPDTLELIPAFEVPVRFLDPLGAPVRGCAVDLLLGCGHTPAVSTVRTDQDGIARLPGTLEQDVIRDLWPVLPGYRSEYHHVPWPLWITGVPPQPVHLWPTPAFDGTVLDHHGRPVAGVFVGAPECHRGPWTVTDARGAFQLCGASRAYPLHPLQVIRPGEKQACVEREQPPPGQSVILRLPAPGAAPVEEPLVPATIHLRDQGDGKPIAAMPFSVARRDDGFTVHGTTDVDGDAELDVPRGELVVRAGGAFATHAAGTSTLRSDAAAPEVTLTLLRNPTVRIVAGELPPGVDVSLGTATGGTDATDAVRAGEPVPVPATGPMTLWIGMRDRRRAVAVTEAQRAPDAAPIELAPWTPPVVRGRLLDAAGSPTSGMVGVTFRKLAWRELSTHVTVEDGGVFTITPDCHGKQHLLVSFGADDRFRALRIPIEVPDREGAVVDVGDLRCPDRPAQKLRLLGSDGSELGDAKLTVTRDGQAKDCAFAQGDNEPQFSEWLRTGDRLRIAAPGHAQRVVELIGASPWTVQLTGGTLEIEAFDPQGNPLPDALVLLDDDAEPRSAHGRPCLIEGVPAGPHRLWVYGPGRLPRRYAFTLTEGEDRRFAVRLNARP